MEILPTYDPRQTLTLEWVRNVLPRISALCTVEVVTQGGIAAWRCIVDEPVREQVAWRVAITIAALRLAVVPELFFTWFAHTASTTDVTIAATAAEKMRQRGLLVAVGEPGDLANTSHFYGLI